MTSNLPVARSVVSPSLIKGKPIFIEKFDLGIGEEWLPRMVREYSDKQCDKLTDMAKDVREWLFTDKTCDELADMTECLPDVGSIMDVDEVIALSCGAMKQ